MSARRLACSRMAACWFKSPGSTPSMSVNWLFSRLRYSTEPPGPTTKPAPVMFSTWFCFTISLPTAVSTLIAWPL